MAGIDLNLLENYSHIQRALLQQISLEYGFDKFLQSIPKEGTISIEAVSWKYRRHGCGIKFLNTNDQTVVDAHTIFEKIPEAFDSWRILLYAESLGLKNIDENIVQSEFKKMIRDGVLTAVADSGLYVLAHGTRKMSQKL